MTEQNAPAGGKNGLVIKDWPYRVICTRAGRDITPVDAMLFRQDFPCEYLGGSGAQS